MVLEALGVILATMLLIPQVLRLTPLVDLIRATLRLHLLLVIGVLDTLAVTGKQELSHI